MLLAALSFTTMVACVKVARVELSTFEVVWWRGVVSVPLCALWLGRGPWVIRARGLFALRVVFGFTAMACYYAAAGGLAVANLTLIGRLQPIVVAIVAPMLLGSSERADGRTWLLTALGVVGCGVLVAPELESGNPAGLIALGAVLTSAVAHTILRRLGRTDHPRTIVFWFQLCVTAMALAWVTADLGHLPEMPRAGLLPWLGGVGLFAALGQNLMTRAYQLDRAAVVSAASHASPVFAVVIDIVAFSTPPSTAVLVGGALVLTAALALLFHRPSKPPESS